MFSIWGIYYHNFSSFYSLVHQVMFSVASCFFWSSPYQHMSALLCLCILVLLHYLLHKFIHISCFPFCLHLCSIGLQFSLYYWYPWYHSLWKPKHFSISRLYLLYYIYSLHTIIFSRMSSFFFFCIFVLYLPCKSFSWCCLCSKTVNLAPTSFYILFCILCFSFIHCFCSFVCDSIFGVLRSILWFCMHIGC